MKIFVIGGKAKCGKNTFGEYLSAELKNYGYNPCVMHITEPLYSYARNYFSWNGHDNSKPREFLQKMGIEIIRDKMGKKYFLLNRLFEDIEILSNFFDAFIITDARLSYEFTEIKNKYSDAVTIKLIRNNYDDELKNDEANHVTETEIKNYDNFDYIIENKGLGDLRKQAISLVRDVEAKKDVIDRGEVI